MPRRHSRPLDSPLLGPLLAPLLGVDVGGTKLALAVGDAEGRILARSRRPAPSCGDGEKDVAAILEAARELLDEADVAPEALAGVGLSVPGPIDPDTGFVCSPPNLPGWRDVPIAERFREGFRCPVRIENDANAAALAEWRFGAGRGCKSLVYLTMSTGIGGGLVLGGRLHRGAGWNAGEIGHVPVEWDGELCACGGRGCLEAYAGGDAWTRRLRSVAPATSRATALAGGVERLRPEHVVAAAGEGDSFARAEIDRFNGYLVRGITILAFALAPDRIVLGTIPTRAGEALCLGPVREGVRRRVWPGLAARLEIVATALPEEGPYLAGLAAALDGRSFSSD